VAPTGAGESFGADARRVVAAADRISLEAARAVRGAAGRVVVGVASTTWIFDLLSRATAEFVRDPSAAELSIEDVPSPRQVASLNEARIDVALGHRYPIVEDVNPNIERVTVVPDTLDVALLPANHPLAAKKSIALADLASLPLLFMKREFSPGFHDLVVLTMSRASFVPKLESSYDHLPSIWALVAQGVGWGLGWRGQLSKPPQGVVGVPLRDFSLPWGIEMSYRRAETRKPVLDVLAAIKRAAAN
jgi:DNA-binding transcriptional LysR family regulator